MSAKYVVYKATSPSGKTYIGITNNFKRRMKEHLSSPYAFGSALRKYGRENFQYEFEPCETVEEAVAREAELVNQDALDSGLLYNETLGGQWSDVLRGNNPMHNPDVLAKHTCLFVSGGPNPIHDPDNKRRMIESQARKPVSIDGVIYPGVREAARQIGSYRQFVVHRLRSKNYPTWFYVS